MLPRYENGVKIKTHYYHFSYAFKTPGEHSITFTAEGLSEVVTFNVAKIREPNKMENPNTYLEAIIKPLMSQPEAKIENKVDELGTLLTVTVAKEDMGKIIGKAGETAKAIRRLIHQWE